MSLGEGKEARGEPACRYKAQNRTPELRARPRRRPSPGRTPLLPARLPATRDPFLSSNGNRGGEVPARSPLDPKQQQKTKNTPPQRPREPVPRPSPHGVPGPARLTCRLRRGTALRGRGARRWAPEQQQRQQQQQRRRWRAAAPGGGGAEESPGFALRRHLYPTSGGGGGDSAAERSRPSFSAPQPVPAPQARLQPGPARPARPPRAPRGKRLRAPPSCSGVGRRAEKESQYIPGESYGGVARSLQVPGAATRRRLGLLTVERGGRRPRGGGRAPERAVPRTLTAAHALLPSPRAPSSRPAACRAPIPAIASRAAAAVEPSWRRGRRRAGSPPPRSLTLRSRARAPGARAGRCCCCCWRQGNPGEAIRLLASRLPLLTRGRDFPSPRRTASKGTETRGRGAPTTELLTEAASLRAPLCPGPLYRASEETEWPPGGNLGSPRVGARIYVLAKNNSGPFGSCWGPGEVPVGGGRPHRADLWLPLGRYPARLDCGAPGPHRVTLGPGSDKGAESPLHRVPRPGPNPVTQSPRG